MLDHDLGRAEDVAGGGEPDGGVAECDGLAIGQRAAGRRAMPSPRRAGHDGQGLGGGEHRVVAGAGMVGMAVADHGQRHGAQRVDEEVAGPAVEAFGPDLEPGLGVGGGHR